MSERCEEKKNKSLSSREWIMVCVLIVLIQLLLHYWTSESMSSGEVLAYVSFAGTIVSIILAVLAIIYSFVQTQAQQTTSDSISREIFRLTDVATRIDATSRGVTTAVSELPTVMAQLSGLPKAMSDEIKTVMSDLSSSTISLHEKTESMRTEILEKLSGGHTPSMSHEHVDESDISFSSYRGVSSLVLASYMIYSGRKYISLCKDAKVKLSKEHAEKAIFMLSRADAMNESYYMIDYLSRSGDDVDYVFNDDVEYADGVRKLKLFFIVYAKSIDKVYSDNKDTIEVAQYFANLFEEDGFDGDSASEKWSS